jgi:hypothetical protein
MIQRVEEAMDDADEGKLSRAALIHFYTHFNSPASLEEFPLHL